jgi:hypothetical protein
LQVNLEFKGDRAAFLRVYERGDARQTALVLLNKGDSATRFEIDRRLSRGTWRDAASGETFEVPDGGGALATTVAAHGVRVLFFGARNADAGLAAELEQSMKALRPASAG